MLRVGITGGIACGKSHVLGWLREAGLPSLDLDTVAHEIMAPGGAAHAGVVEAFGRAILDASGRIDRRVLGAMVFADPGVRARLNAIVHPLVRAEEARRAAELAAAGQPLLLTDAALLVESGVHLRFDRLVVVHCPEPEQLRRLMARDGIGEDAARARTGAQMPVSQKRRFAHLELDTGGPMPDTRQATLALAEELRALAARPRPRAGVPTGAALACLAAGPALGPGGLHPGVLLEEALETGGLELERLAARLSPPRTGVPWYRAGEQPAAGPGPESLAPALAVWALARRGDDPDFLVSAAASVARLTHADAESMAGACLAALALADVLLGRRGGGAEREALAARWGGAPARESLRQAVAAGFAHPGDPGAARAAAPSGSAALAGAVSAAALAQAPAGVPPRLARLLERLLAPQA